MYGGVSGGDDHIRRRYTKGIYGGNIRRQYTEASEVVAIINGNFGGDHIRRRQKWRQ